MPISAIKIDERIADVAVTDEVLEVRLRDGRRVSTPLAWFPRLQAATPKARNTWELSAGGFGIHWPLINEDVGVAGLLSATPVRMPKP